MTREEMMHCQCPECIEKLKDIDEQGVFSKQGGDMFFRTNGGRYLNLFEVALELHMSNTGASDGFYDSEELRRLQWIKRRLENWNSEHESGFDLTVYALLGSVVDETELQISIRGTR